MILSSFDIAIGAVLALGVIGFVVAWQAGKAARSAAPTDVQELRRTLDRIQESCRTRRT